MSSNAHPHACTRLRANKARCDWVVSASDSWTEGKWNTQGSYEYKSLFSSMTAVVGFPAPWPARVSTRSSRGFRCGLSGYPASVCCSVAVSLKECSGATRSSWSPDPPHKHYINVFPDRCCIKTVRINPQQTAFDDGASAMRVLMLCWKSLKFLPYTTLTKLYYLRVLCF